MTPRQCGTPWGVCDACMGQGLALSAGECWCPSCGRDFPPETFESPCRQPATSALTDAHGVTGFVCASHAAHPRARRLWKRVLRGEA
jgi:hypothetical protein